MVLQTAHLSSLRPLRLQHRTDFFFTMTANQLTTIRSTITTTVMVTSTVAYKRDANPAPALAAAPRQVTTATDTIPAYASACSGTAGYSSACSCIGVTATTATLPTPTTTVTVFSTTTVSTTAVCSTPSHPPHFRLQLVNSSSPFDGTYGRSGTYSYLYFNDDTIDDVATFSNNLPGNLYLEKDNVIGVLYGGASGAQFGPIIFSNLPDVYTQAVDLICSNVGGTLACVAEAGVNILQICPPTPTDPYPDGLYIGSSLQAGCYAPTLKIVSFC